MLFVRITDDGIFQAQSQCNNNGPDTGDGFPVWTRCLCSLPDVWTDRAIATMSLHQGHILECAINGDDGPQNAKTVTDWIRQVIGSDSCDGMLKDGYDWKTILWEAETVDMPSDETE